MMKEQTRQTIKIHWQTYLALKALADDEQRTIAVVVDRMLAEYKASRTPPAIIPPSAPDPAQAQS